MNTSVKTSVAIIGAGAYALSLAAHLQEAGIAYRVFGEPMRFWAGIAAAGENRFLKSFCFGTSLASPSSGLTFADYNQPRGLETFEPCSMANFVDYGHWFQKNLAEHIEVAQVTSIKKEDGYFTIRSVAGVLCKSERVVVATGLAGCAHIPPIFSALKSDYVSHTSDIVRFADFRGLRVAVIGAGQSALEAAALLNEAGAKPQLLVRASRLKWNSQVLPGRSLWRRLRSPLSALGSGPIAWLLSTFPAWLHCMPQQWRINFVRRHLPATGAWWLQRRVEGVVPVQTNVEVQEVTFDNNEISLHCVNRKTGDEKLFAVDRVILGTGYALEVERQTFIDSSLRLQVELVGGSPRLDQFFQSTVAGLHFIGPMSAMSFGPLFRFVAGADYTAKAIAAYLKTKTCYNE